MAEAAAHGREHTPNGMQAPHASGGERARAGPIITHAGRKESAKLQQSACLEHGAVGMGVANRSAVEL